MATSLFELLPSIPYGPPKRHHWGPITSTLNWCEEDYYLTEYCAEFVNTMTNLIFIYVSCYGIYTTLKEGHDRIFTVTFCGLLCVGVGSFLFHATLWYSMQLVDELSMLYTTLLVCWLASFSHNRSTTFATIFGFLCTLFAVAISLIYHHLGDPVFHQNAYAILTAGVLGHSFYIMETKLRKIDSAEVNRMWKMVSWGVGLFLTGFLLWSLDNIYCGRIKNWRHAVGLPWGVLAEGHGWWHLLTAVGAYYELVWGLYLRCCLQDRREEFKLDWPGYFSLPVVRKWREGERGREEARKLKKVQ
ncbi:alkaline phytoceramidase [Ascodesmis nigricans]|uniref:Alkaline phytoceramidase n=1 Tax=Ascodesmis nigricans TaxID=341454 RepID=A0A4S2MT72_9PEZI|nr:alkaline phytoceramidase [Ascodesmis nigricans]